MARNEANKQSTAVSDHLLEHSVIARMAQRFGVDPNKMLGTLKATAFKSNGDVSDEQFMALCVVADQYKLNPFTKEIYAYPDKQNGIVPVVGVDGWTRIINEHPQMDGFTFNYSEEVVESDEHSPCNDWIEVVIHRKDRTQPIIVREYFDECYRPPIKKDGQNGPYVINGPWQSHTRRMLRHKVWIQGARLAFGFAGIYDEDEAQRIVEVQGEVVSTASGKPKTRAPQQVTSNPDPVTIDQEPERQDVPVEHLSPAEVIELSNACIEAGIEISAFADQLQVSSLDLLPISRMADAYRILEMMVDSQG